VRRLSGLLLIALAALAYAPAPVLARVKASDAIATHDYLEARIASEHTTRTESEAELKAIAALAAQVAAECPGVLAGAPRHVKGEKFNQSQLEISGELLSATFGVAEHVQHPADARFARVVRHLHWSNPKLTKLLRSLAIEQAAQSAIPSPDLCSDLKFWVASDYSAVSAGTKQYLHRLDVVSSITQIQPEPGSEPHEPVSSLLNLNGLVAHRLERYENHADRRLAKKALPPEAELTDPALRPLLEAVGRVYVVLRSPAPAAQTPS
jgi:hypothetical protein